MSSFTTRPSPWLTAEEAAPQLATTAHNLRRLARLSRSPILTRRVGSRWLFSRADLLRFVTPTDALPALAQLPSSETIVSPANPSSAPTSTSPALDALVLPGFEVAALQPTIKGRTCIEDASGQSRPQAT